ncbi:MAG: hypothetical protein A3J10_02430 [Candidatus Sungbacteria bacterium RIFCSPLOWO2_02_FULL_54_10]|uniref:Uncharacterized protein n=2 Tax=Candidatus Sungiibacteriota TaxID=1817917 RepID=A0A1G2L4F2_9BACT|nr:MAG: hypothetical protein A2679_02315 [Candidatus Sungbacteria bacterium RIFCSPHIGHO2_01_FULL_54_26]OHA03213.1 MAG: hypothetical protein A3C92_01740 [Candidatus Sungbacteria bacterium RIFCSPHIGHO2_02_FULL_53_17]OHA06568.1 MAG: hypothetical protein A3B34_01510 [Candidatus Sungbacteria bacterium RIFCSPLOWO2_01_FULL_54_21]OHA13790.1 MAG: hypothetical protein A3J10_02430 [Candidatus Sungbacteria bacterium RIFCSPLOWO2_02_FULL_54_10]
MFAVNLLPAYEKKIIRMEEMRRAVVLFGGCALVIFCAGYLMLTPSLLLTRLATAELARSRALEEESARHGMTDEVSGRMRTTHDVLQELHAYTAEPPRASVLLERFIAPGQGIAILSFSIKNEGQAAMTGHAATRADLLRFEERLRASNRFYEITFPLSNITRERDIQFSVQGKIKPEYGL